MTIDILLLLGPADLARLACSSTSCAALAQLGELWKALAIKQWVEHGNPSSVPFNNAVDVAPQQRDGLSWSEVFRLVRPLPCALDEDFASPQSKHTHQLVL